MSNPNDQKIEGSDSPSASTAISKTDENLVSHYNNWDEEWKMCRNTTDKFDATLLDLRKYGFSVITGLITAGSILGFSQPGKIIEISVIGVSMALIVALYWLDIFYQNLLYGALFRTHFLELFRLERGLSVYISGFYKATKVGALLHLVYVGFLVGLFFLGLYVVGWLSNLDLIVRNLGLIGSFVICAIGIALIYGLSDYKKDNVSKDLSRKFNVALAELEGKPKERKKIADDLEKQIIYIIFKD